MKIAIVGLGLIGGSFAKTIKNRTDYYVAGYDISKNVVENAISENIIDKYTNNFSGFDMIIIALYPKDTLEFLNKHSKEFSKDCLIVDSCGVKESVCKPARDLLINSGSVFIGGHPMAGREFSGYENSVNNLFDKASMILTPLTETPSTTIDRAKDFFISLGFKKISITTPEHHDKIIAYTSQLAHVVSSAYMQSPTAKEFSGFSAGSFADLTRVAKLNPDMWTELFLSNSRALSNEIDTLIKSLEKFKNYIDNNSEKELHDILEKGSSIKENLISER